MNQKFSERLEEVMHELRLNAAQLAEELGYSHSNSIRGYMRGKSLPNVEFFERLTVKFPSVNTEFLLNGNGSPLKKEEEVSFSKIDTPQDSIADYAEIIKELSGTVKYLTDRCAQLEKENRLLKEDRG